MLKRLFWIGLIFVLGACSSDTAEEDLSGLTPPTGKADGFEATRVFEVLLTDPHCDVCTGPDKAYLQEHSRIVQRIIELIDSAEESVDVAQFTFSQRPIEEALLRAHERGVTVTLAMNHAMANGDNVPNRLKARGVEVHFVAGKDNGNYLGLQHAKFMIVDGRVLLTGSNNWSSTGTTINDENTIVLTTRPDDPMMQAFECYHDAMVRKIFENAKSCSSEEVKFTPGTGAWSEIRTALREAEGSVDVLMHHLLYSDSVKLLAQTAERGVRVRVVVNAADRDEISGSNWERFARAGGEVRYKLTEESQYQMMHNKLAIVDGRVLYNGSGNWSGSAFFNNYEFYIRYAQPEIVRPFNELFEKLWAWSLTADSLDVGRTAAEQDALELSHYFGNLHAHFHLVEEGKWLDDGELQRRVNDEIVDVSEEAGDDPARHAFEYARDHGGLDFMALTPHVQDDDPSDALNIANMTHEAYAALIDSATFVSEDSLGRFVALPGMEWSTNSRGNHVNILGSRELAKVVRGDFKTLYEGFLPAQELSGDRPILMFNHPRTFKHPEAPLRGNWDQVFGVNLLEIANNSERRDKFNDFGLDDYEPLLSVRETWTTGEVLPDEAVVRQTKQNIARVVSPYARLFEVTVGRGTELLSEEPINPSLNTDDETGEVTRYHKAYTDWDYYLLNGFKMAPVANHDNHGANWGTGHTTRTVLLASELSEDALLDAMRSRAAYATEAPSLAISKYADERVRQGGEIRTMADRITLRVRFEDVDYSGDLEVGVRIGKVGGDVVEEQQRLVLGTDAWHTITVRVPETSEHFVYLEVLQPGPNRMAWTSPIWVTRLR